MLDRGQENTFFNKTTSKKSCRSILQDWLDRQDPDESIWAKMSYAEIVQDIMINYGINISASSVAIVLPALVAQQVETSVDDVLTVREMIASEDRHSGAKVHPEILEILKTKLNDGDSPKQCAHELGLHYNTVLKYRHAFEMETE